MFQKNSLSKNLLSKGFWIERASNRPVIVALWLMAFVAIYQILKYPPIWHLEPSMWANPASIFGYIIKFDLLPVDFLNSVYLIRSLQLITTIGLLLWGTNILIPISPFLSTISFTLLNSIKLEKFPYAGDHTSQLLTLTLWILTFWYYFDRKKIGSLKSWLNAKEFPRWAFFLIVLTVSSNYFLAGLYKITYPQTSWANGTTLQVYIHHFAHNPDNIFSSWLLSSNYWSQMAQKLVVMIEMTAILAIFSNSLRYITGALLLLFQLGVWLVFDWPFYGNMAIILTFMLPFHLLFSRKV